MIATRPSLTDLQQKVLCYLEDQRDATGIMPSTREVQRHFQFASQSQSVSVLRNLEKKGVLMRMPRKARGLLLGNRADVAAKKFSPVPVLGTVPAGYPVDSSENVLGFLPVDANAFGSPPGKMIFSLLVRGDSMIGAYINDGDHAICQSTECRTPRPGEIVAALIDGESTLKRYLVLENMPCLKAENSKYPDLIPARELTIQGVCVGSLRGYQT